MIAQSQGEAETPCRSRWRCQSGSRNTLKTRGRTLKQGSQRRSPTAVQIRPMASCAGGPWSRFRGSGAEETHCGTDTNDGQEKEERDGPGAQAAAVPLPLRQ